MTASMTFSELPPQCQAWEGFMFGDRPMAAVHATPDVWIPVFELTVGEGLLLALGIRPRSVRNRPYALRFDSLSGRYLAYPLALMPAAAGLPRAPRASDIWAPILGAVRERLLRMTRP